MTKRFSQGFFKSLFTARIKKDQAFNNIATYPREGLLIVKEGCAKPFLSKSPVKNGLAYRPDIDGLRALAVLSVVGYHAFPNWLPGGFIGVDLFFVISGFLISSIILTHCENNTFSLVDFYQRRIKRIFPALIIVLLFSCTLGWFALYPDEYKQLGRHIAAGVGFVSNFVLWKEAGYFDTYADTKPLLHLWSLGIEEQFYIIWPCLLWVAYKRKIKVLGLIIFCAIVSFVFNLYMTHHNLVAAFYSPQSRCWELLSGSLLAWLFNEWQVTDSLAGHRQKLATIFSLLGLIILLGAVMMFSNKTIFPGAWALLPILAGVLLISAGPTSWLNKQVLCHPVLRWFGLISFPLYLWHWPLLSFARIMEGDIPTRSIRIIAVLMAILFATLTYYAIEKPIRWGKKANSLKIVCLIVLMIVTGCIGLYIKKQNGLATRFKAHPELLSLKQNYFQPANLLIQCSEVLNEFKGLAFDGGCFLTQKKTPKLLFIGDSHNIHYAHEVSKQFQEPALIISQTSCLPFSNNTFLANECKKKYDAILAFIQSNHSIKQVYLSGYWAYLMTGGFSKTGTNWRIALPVEEQPERVAEFLANGKEFITRVIQSKKKVVFLQDIPDLDFNIDYCYIKRPLTLPHNKGHNKNCSLDFTTYQNRTHQYDIVIVKLLANFPEVKVYNPRSVFCDAHHCITGSKKIPYYFNGDHLNMFGARKVIRDLRESLHVG